MISGQTFIALTFLSVLVFTCLSSAAQSADTTLLSSINLSSDSVILSVWNVQTKETSMPGDEPQEFSFELDRKRLSETDANLLIQLLKAGSSFDDSRALLYHHNLVFEFWQKGNKQTDVYISTLTGNIDLIDTWNKNTFQNNCSSKLNTLILEFLRSYAAIDLVSDVGTDGLED
jgi:hypothetical protein